jgi:hypothetical protein
MPTLKPIGTASTDMDGRQNPIPMRRADAAEPAIGKPVDWQGKGQVVMFSLSQNPSLSDGGQSFVGDVGAQVMLSPGGGDGPFFTDSHGQIVPGATSFVSTLGYYYNLAPGTYTLTLTDPSNDCEPILFPFAQVGYPLTTPAHSLQFPVVAGYITEEVGMLCLPNSMPVSTDAGGGG